MDAVRAHVQANLDMLDAIEKAQQAALEDYASRPDEVIVDYDADCSDGLSGEWVIRVWLTREELCRGKLPDDDPEDVWKDEWISYDYITETAMNTVPLVKDGAFGLPQTLGEALSEWVCENVEDAKAWLAGKQAPGDVRRRSLGWGSWSRAKQGAESLPLEHET